MLSNNVFLDGVEMLITEFEEKGFTMNKKKSQQWYDFLNDEEVTDYEFNIRIRNVLKYCNHSPSMSDLFSEKNNNDNVPKRSPKETRLVYVIRENRPVPLAFCRVKADETYYEELEECIEVLRDLNK